MKIEFKEDGHRYYIDGVSVPSVTECLDLLTDFKNVDRAVLEAAAAFGRHGHKAMNLLVRGRLNWGTLDKALLPYILSGQRYLEQHAHTIIASELVVGSPTLKLAGTIDLVTETKGGYAIIDWKFTDALPFNVGLQTAAYDRLFRYGNLSVRGRVCKRICVQLKEVGYKQTVLNDPADWNNFQSALNVTHLRRKYGIK